MTPAPGAGEPGAPHVGAEGAGDGRPEPTGRASGAVGRVWEQYAQGLATMQEVSWEIASVLDAVATDPPVRAEAIDEALDAVILGLTDVDPLDDSDAAGRAEVAEQTARTARVLCPDRVEGLIALADRFLDRALADPSGRYPRGAARSVIRRHGAEAGRAFALSWYRERADGEALEEWVRALDPPWPALREVVDEVPLDPWIVTFAAQKAAVAGRTQDLVECAARFHVDVPRSRYVAGTLAMWSFLWLWAGRPEDARRCVSLHRARDWGRQGPPMDLEPDHFARYVDLRLATDLRERADLAFGWDELPGGSKGHTMEVSRAERWSLAAGSPDLCERMYVERAKVLVDCARSAHGSQADPVWDWAADAAAQALRVRGRSREERSRAFGIHPGTGGLVAVGREEHALLGAELARQGRSPERMPPADPALRGWSHSRSQDRRRAVRAALA